MCRGPLPRPSQRRRRRREVGQYLLSLASDRHAMLVSGDGHLVALANDSPIHKPAGFLTMLHRSTS